MATSIDEQRAKVQAAFEAALAIAQDRTPGRLWEVEPRLWSRLLALGRALITLWLTAQATRPRAASYQRDGATYALGAWRTTHVGTRFGKIAFARPVGQRVGRRGGPKTDRPVDREVGLVGGFTPATVLGVVYLAALLPFASARRVFARHHEWTPSPRAALRMVDATGAEARPFLEQARAPDDEGEVLVIQVDGRGAPMISGAEHRRRRQPRVKTTARTARLRRRQRRHHRPRRRRKKGDKAKNAKLAVVGVIYTLRRTPHGLEGPINKRLIATFHGHEALFVWLHAEAKKRGLGRKQTVFLADGSPHIWRLQPRYFPDAETGLDWYHVVEKLWAAGACVFRESSPELGAWVGAQTTKLRRGQACQVIEALTELFRRIPKTGPGTAARRDKLQDIIEYLAEHKHRMRYHLLRRQDLDIGTGAVEGAVRNLIAIRLDGPGMRWGIDRAEHVLHLRCIVLNDQWDDFAEHLARREGLALASQPTPARPHDAKAKVAA